MTISGLHFARAMRAKAQGARGFAGVEGTTLSGRGVYGIKQGAIFYVGRSFVQLQTLIDQRFPPATQPLGYGLGQFARRSQRGGQIPAERIEGLLQTLRGQQIGPKNVGASFVRMRGIYEGMPENTVQIAIIYVGIEPDFAAFRENMLSIGEELATAFAQKEVIVELQGDDGKPVSHTCSPTGFPPPTDSDFNDFIGRAIEARMRSR